MDPNGIFIKACEAHRDRVRAQFDTWANWNDVIPFYGGQVDAPDDYAGLPQKTKGICRIATNLSFEHGFFCDTDTYVHVPRLLASGFEQYDYIGHELEGSPRNVRYASGGAGYWLSKKAMQIIAECDPEPFKAEDYMVGSVLIEHGIKLHHDPRYTLALDSWPEPGNDLITKHLSMNGPYEVSMMYAAHKRAHP